MDHLFRTYYGKMVAYLSAKYGYQQLDTILDAIQEAFESALQTWKTENLPRDQFAWLYQVAQRKLLNELKKTTTAEKHVAAFSQAVELETVWQEEEAEDDFLYLLLFFAKLPFTPKNKLVVTLYFLCGFSRKEVAKALLSDEESVKKILSRAKDYIKRYAVRYNRATVQNDGADVAYLLQVLYLMFNEGHKSSRKKITTAFDLCFEAMRLAKLLHTTYPQHSGLNALLALLFFTAARFPARLDGANLWIELAEQDRRLYEPKLIASGYYHLNLAKTHGDSLSKYYLEALISSLHSSAPSYAATDWKTISFLYKQLEALEPLSFAQRVNGLIAASHFTTKELTLEALDTLLAKAPRSYLFTIFMAQAYVCNLHCDWTKARQYYQHALTKTIDVSDKAFIYKKLAHLSLPAE